MNAAAESEGEEARSEADVARVRTEAEEGGGSVGMECTWDAALRGEQVRVGVGEGGMLGR